MGYFFIYFYDFNQKRTKIGDFEGFFGITKCIHYQSELCICHYIKQKFVYMFKNRCITFCKVDLCFSGASCVWVM